MNSTTNIQPPEIDLAAMRKAVRDEYSNPFHPESGPDWQAAITDYLQRGGSDMEIGELQQLFREACEAENLDY